MMADFVGWETLQGFVGSVWGLFVIATLANIIAFSFVVFGIRWFARIQKAVMAIGIGGTIVFVAAGPHRSLW